MWKRIRHSPWVSRDIPVVLVLVSLAGCAELSHQATRLYGLDCRQEKLQHGQCVAAR
jgi:hypothetical protein